LFRFLRHAFSHSSPPDLCWYCFCLGGCGTRPDPLDNRRRFFRRSLDPGYTPGTTILFNSVEAKLLDSGLGCRPSPFAINICHTLLFLLPPVYSLLGRTPLFSICFSFLKVTRPLPPAHMSLFGNSGLAVVFLPPFPDPHARLALLKILFFFFFFVFSLPVGRLPHPPPLAPCCLFPTPIPFFPRQTHSFAFFAVQLPPLVPFFFDQLSHMPSDTTRLSPGFTSRVSCSPFSGFLRLMLVHFTLPPIISLICLAPGSYLRRFPFFGQSFYSPSPLFCGCSALPCYPPLPSCNLWRTSAPLLLLSASEFCPLSLFPPPKRSYFFV